MIYIVHGENATASRKYIQELFQTDSNFVKKELDISDLELLTLNDELNSSDMFGNKQFIILDISKLGNKNIEPYLNIIKNCPIQTVLVIYSDKNLLKSNILIKSLPALKAKDMSFANYFQGNVFRFIDAVFSKEKKLAYVEYQKLLIDGVSPFYIFTMFLYNLRNLAYLKFDTSQKSKMSPSAKSKLSKIEKKYTQNDIKNIYSALYDFEKKVKIGDIDQNLFIPLCMEKIIECPTLSQKNI